MGMPKIINLALRAIGVSAAVAVIWLLWTHKPSVVTTLVLSLGTVIFGRLIYRSNVFPNPLGNGWRSFSIRLVLSDILGSSGCFVGSLVWAVIGSLGVKYRVLPDTNLVAYGLIGAPIVALMLAGAFLLGRGMFTAMFGGSAGGID
jgi:hypothetical protein